jgi:hypothetical protein
MSKGIVTTMFVCPRCAADISANSKPSKCPKCGFKFSKIGKSELSDKFEAGKSPYDQLYELVQQDMEKFLDQPANKFIPGMTKEQADQLRVSNKVRLAFFQNKRKAEMHKFFETVPIIEMQSWLQSTLHFYQCLMRRGDKESVIAACSFGEKIGEIAKHTKKLLELGAQYYDGTGTDKSTSGEDNASND